MSGRIDTAPWRERYEYALSMGGRLLLDIDRPGLRATRNEITEYSALIRETRADLNEVRAHNEALR